MPHTPATRRMEGRHIFALVGYVTDGMPHRERARWAQKKVMLMRKMVLIADDNTFVRHALSELFKREFDFDVCGVAENGQEAIELAARLRPDLIVLDLSMPVMNGLDAARVLKGLMPSVPLMMYSAFEDRSSERRARSIGISELVSKSERFSVLVDKARELVHSKAA